VKGIVSSISAIIVEIHHDNSRTVLEPHCLRPIQPFHVNERVQVSTWKDTGSSECIWLHGVIVEIDSLHNGSLSVLVECDNEIMTQVRPQDIRRLDTNLFNIGDWIQVLDGEESCEGKILHAYPDRTFLVRCLDGDIKTKVPAFRLQRYQSQTSNY
jgi:hypothetical protein